MRPLWYDPEVPPADESRAAERSREARADFAARDFERTAASWFWRLLFVAFGTLAYAAWRTA